MNELKPWEYKTESVRTSDTTYNFIIFCEDEVSEPIYLKQFEREHLKVNVIPNQKSKKLNIDLAITHCRENSLIIYNDKVPKLNVTDGTQVWCVFDRDIEADQDKILLNHTSFDTSIKTATDAGIALAWSNDAFELWLLLHFEDIVFEDHEYRHRMKYYDRLTVILKGLKFAPEYQKVVDSENYQYKYSMKRPNKFIAMVLPNLKGKTEVALERARKLEELHKSTKSYHEMAPCTMMHKLVGELIRLA